MRKLLLLSILGVAVAPASANAAASVSIADFSNAGPGRMQATISYQGSGNCYPVVNCAEYLEAATRPTSASCPGVGTPPGPYANDPAYYNKVINDPNAALSGSPITNTFQFDPGTYTDGLGTHPLPPGPLKLCAYIVLESIGSPRTTAATTSRAGTYGSPAATPPTPTTSSKKKCKKKKGKKTASVAKKRKCKQPKKH